uniref:Uncharacterized protein n=1 Tax=viral metagenome TaxID=1070528 RepID=A0A6H2A6B9_9ZZZZ
MSNYYYRDNEGNWFVKDGKKLYPIEFSGSLEIAFIMGKIAALDKIRGEMNELALQIGDTQIRGVDSTPVSGE